MLEQQLQQQIIDDFTVHQHLNKTRILLREHILSHPTQWNQYRGTGAWVHNTAVVVDPHILDSTAIVCAHAVVMSRACVHTGCIIGTGTVVHSRAVLNPYVWTGCHSHIDVAETVVSLRVMRDRTVVTQSIGFYKQHK